VAVRGANSAAASVYVSQVKNLSNKLFLFYDQLLIYFFINFILFYIFKVNGVVWCFRESSWKSVKVSPPLRSKIRSETWKWMLTRHYYHHSRRDLAAAALIQQKSAPTIVLVIISVVRLLDQPERQHQTV
jgi:hypothetical protein